eukprot:12346332-Alexandrium_andersonii.AAC.1
MPGAPAAASSSSGRDSRSHLPEALSTVILDRAAGREWVVGAAAMQGWRRLHGDIFISKPIVQGAPDAWRLR